MTLRQLQYLVVVAEELHFGRAARRLHVSQPALSHQVRKLEQRLGLRLLERTSRHVELTNGGVDVVAAARSVLRQVEALEAAAAQHRAEESRPLTVGFTGSAASRVLPAILERLRTTSPRALVSLRELTAVRYELLRSGELDVVLGRVEPEEMPDLDVAVLAREARVAVLPSSHRLAGRQAIRLAELGGDAFITQPERLNPEFRRRWLAEQQAHGLPGRIEAEASSIQEFLELVAAGRGVCLAPETTAQFNPRPDVVYVSVLDATGAATSLVSRRGRLSPSAAAFRDAAAAVIH